MENDEPHGWRSIWQPASKPHTTHTARRPPTDMRRTSRFTTFQFTVVPYKIGLIETFVKVQKELLEWYRPVADYSIPMK